MVKPLRTCAPRAWKSFWSESSVKTAPRHRTVQEGGLSLTGRLFAACGLIAALGCAGLRLFVAHPAGAAPAAITIDYPEEGSVFPPDMAAPTFVWRDASAGTTSWRIEVAFPDGSDVLRIKAEGERLRTGEIDKCCVGLPGELPRLTPREASARSWKPDPRTWAAIKRHSAGRPAVVTITGLRGENSALAVSRGQVTLQTSNEPVGAPIFYRDVPLRMPGETENGSKPIQPPRGVMQPLGGWMGLLPFSVSPGIL